MLLRLISSAALLCAATAQSGLVLAAPAPAPSVANGACTKLAADYDQVEKALAMTEAEGVGDNSAPRETNRQVEDSNYLARASMTLTLMEANHCALPDHAPSSIRYLSSALTCATDRLKSPIGSETPSCKMENWHAGE